MTITEYRCRDEPHPSPLSLSARQQPHNEALTDQVEALAVNGSATTQIALPRPEVHRGRFPSVFLDLELDLLTFIERP